MTFSRIHICWLLAVLLGLAGCESAPADKGRLSLACASENAVFEPYLRRLAHDQGFALDIRYLTSQELVQELAKGSRAGFDAVLAASPEWITLSDPTGAVKDLSLVCEMPLALGVNPDKAKELGLTPEGVEVGPLADLCAQGRLSFVMSSPSQTSLGLAVYLGLARAVAGQAGGISAHGLDQAAQDQLRAVFSGVARSSGSHVWVKSLFETGDYQAMINYRHQLDQTGQEMAAQGREPLVQVPVKGPGLAAQAVLGYVDKGQPDKAEIFKLIKDYLASSKVQARLTALGRVPAAGQAVRAWDRQVLVNMVNLYQEKLRKPSVTVYVAELSAKMAGFAEREVKRALRLALDPVSAGARFLQANPRDKTYLLIYNDKVQKTWRLDKMDQAKLQETLKQLEAMAPKGGANPYTALAEAQAILAGLAKGQYLSEVILIPHDAAEAPGKNLAELRELWSALGQEAPVMGLRFGEFPEVKLDGIAEFSRGRIFDGRSDLAKALFSARSCNN